MQQKGELISFRPDIKVVDCTIRDGGLVNNFYFDDEFVKDGAIVIDVGTSSVDGKITGDVDFDKVIDKASFVTPVPGGVGPMTRAMLMKNTLLAYKHTIYKD